jgi:DNA-binding NtrC family response regulator
VTDDRLRDLERAWRESGALEAREAWRRATVRSAQPWAFGRHVTRVAYRALEAAEAASTHARPLVIVGRPSSGRTTLARAIHEASSRARGPFEELDLRTLSPALQDYQLFGAYGGSFTGQAINDPGAIERAQGGTLLIAVCDWAIAEVLVRGLQRCLVDGESRRIGGSRAFPIDVRIVFEVTDLRFLGEDLTSHLEAEEFVTLEWPSLRSRLEDLPLILGSLETRGLLIESDFYTHCATHDWPGDLREFAAIIERAYYHREYEIPISGIPSEFDRQALALLMGLES